MNTAEQVKLKLSQLEEGLNNSIPGLPTILRDIHSQLKQDPEIVTLLSDEEASILVRGLKQQTKVTIATTALKKSGGGTKALSKTTVDDI